MVDAFRVLKDLNGMDLNVYVKNKSKTSMKDKIKVYGIRIYLTYFIRRSIINDYFVKYIDFCYNIELNK